MGASAVKNLARHIEQPLREGNAALVTDLTNHVLGLLDDLRYVVIVDTDGTLVAHDFAFSEGSPELTRLSQDRLCTACHASPRRQTMHEGLPQIPVGSTYAGEDYAYYSRGNGFLIEVSAPVGDPPVAMARVGFVPDSMSREAASVSLAIMKGFAVAAAVGLILAGAASHFLIRPVAGLLRATEAVRAGNYEARARVYSADEIGRLTIAFNEMAGAIQRSREESEEKDRARELLIEKIVDAQEEERKRVARELHDQLGQSISKTLLTFQAIRGSCGLSDSDCAGLDRELRALIDEVRRLAWDIRPSLLDDYGLDTALARYVDDVSSRAIGIAIEYESVKGDHGGQLPNRVSATLYRVAQEALTNVLRHAKATQASVTLVCRNGMVSLVVEDNGVGFNPAEARTALGRGLGLMGMEERVSLIEGRYSLESLPGQGCRISVSVPVTHAEEEA